MTQEQDEKFEKWWISKFDIPDGIKMTLGYIQQKSFAREGWFAHQEEMEVQFRAIPYKNFYRADRYDTGNEYVLHLWDEQTQESYDIRISKRGET